MHIISKHLNFFIIFVLIINSLITQYFIMLIYLYCLSRLVQLTFLHIFTEFQGIWIFFHYEKCIIIDYNEFINNSILYYASFKVFGCFFIIKYVLLLIITNSLITQYFIMLIYLYYLDKFVRLTFLHISTKFQGIWMFFHYEKCIIIDYNKFINNSILYYANLFISLRQICSAD